MRIWTPLVLVPNPLPSFSYTPPTQDPVECKKDFEHCIGGCGGEVTSTLHYDFNTVIAISELNPDVIGFGGFDAAHANCTIKTDIIEVPLFEGGDSFSVFAERARLNCTLPPT